MITTALMKRTILRDLIIAQVVWKKSVTADRRSTVRHRSESTLITGNDKDMYYTITCV